MRGDQQTAEFISLWSNPPSGLPGVGPFGCLITEDETVTVVEGNQWVIVGGSSDKSEQIVDAIGGRTANIDCADVNASNSDRIDSDVASTESPDALTYEFNCTTDSDIGFAYVEGRVTNISGGRLESVSAVGSWYTSDGSFITSDDALIEYDPLLADQSSPFKVISRYNPSMKRCNVEFQELFGDYLPSRKVGD
jgi:hypothetical protein